MENPNFKERVKLLLSEPGYRTKLLVFVLVGATTTMLAFIVRDAFWRGVLSNFCVTFTAVACIQFMWDFLGGDPLNSQIVALRDQVDSGTKDLQSKVTDQIVKVQEEVKSVKYSMVLMRDLLDGNLGIERMWPSRRTWQVDQDAGLAHWKDLLCRAKEVRILSNTLWNNWFTDDVFMDRLFVHLEQHGAHAQIIVYDPDSRALEIRAQDERDLPVVEGKYGAQMRMEIRAALGRVAEAKPAKELLDSKRMELRLSGEYIHMSQIIQADNKMLVAIYLSGQAGGPSPTLQLSGPEGSYFCTYRRQFDIVWSRAKPIDFMQLGAYRIPDSLAPKPE